MPPSDTTRYISNFIAPEETDRLKGGKNYLFVIAIDAYVHCPPLHNAVKDAQDLIELLCERYPFEPANVITLFNGAATEANMLHGLRELARIITPSDNLLLFFSGHGEFDPVLDEGYWIPVDAQKGAFEDYMANSKVRTILNAIKSHHTFLVVDSCFSGALFSTFRSSGAADRLERDPSRWGLTSGRNEIVEDGKPGANSPFAESLLYHLKNNPAPIGVADLCAKVVEDVTSNSGQTPRGEPLLVEGHRGGQFFFRPRQPESDAVLGAAPEGQASQSGSILYSVPNTMVLHQDTRCEVRIAFLKALLEEAHQALEASVLQEIRVSDVMEVELIDPSGQTEKPFGIRSITSKEQLVDPRDFTQWIFYVTPLREGTFPLLLKVTVIEFLREKERKREVVLEETIKVVAQAREQTLEELARTPYKKATYQFAVAPAVAPSVQPEESGPPSQRPARLTVRRIVAGTLSLLALAILAFLVYPLLQQPALSPTADLQMRLDSAKHYLALAERKARTGDPDYLEAYQLLQEAQTFLEEDVDLQDTIQQRQQQITETISRINERERLAVKSVEEGPAQPMPKSSDLEELAWARAKRIHTPEAYRLFLQEFETGKYREMARAQLEKLQKMEGEQPGKIIPIRPKPAEDLKEISPLLRGKTMTFTDIRDGQEYEAIEREGRYWMLQNLSFKTRGAICYGLQRANCQQYGALYSWRSAQSACPKGWRLPRLREWTALQQALSFEEMAALFPPAGRMVKGAQPEGLGQTGYFWTMNEKGEAAWMVLDTLSRTIRMEKGDPQSAAACRCIKE